MGVAVLPCRPILALNNVSAVSPYPPVQLICTFMTTPVAIAFPLILWMFAIPLWWLFSLHITASAVSTAWSSVENAIQPRERGENRCKEERVESNTMREMREPARKARSETRACWAPIWRSEPRSGPETRRARARASWTVFPEEVRSAG